MSINECLHGKKNVVFVGAARKTDYICGKLRNSRISMKKSLILIVLCMACSVGYANSLERFINKYKEKEGAVYYLFNRNRNYNDNTEGIVVSPMTQKVVSTTLSVMGVEELLRLRLDSCSERVRENFVEGIYDAIPMDYSLLSENGRQCIYMHNADEEFAYILIVNNESPSLTLAYVTNSVVRAVMNDEGSGVDMDKFENYLLQRLEKLELLIQNSGERLKEGIKRIEERAREWSEESENSGIYSL